MPIDRGIFSDNSEFDKRYFPDYAALGEAAQHWKAVGLRVGLTSGSFDMIHQGHALYLEKARSLVDFLVVGVDSDEKIRQRKGPDRPIVPEDERLRMLTHLRGVGAVTLKPADAPRWDLIKTVRPDVLVATRETYSEAEVAELQDNYCGEVVVLDPMATTTTSARLRLLQIGLADKLSKVLAGRLPDMIREIFEEAVHGS